jgi:ABC-2 type transport system ATP-binding protein
MRIIRLKKELEDYFNVRVEEEIEEEKMEMTAQETAIQEVPVQETPVQETIVQPEEKEEQA